MSAMDDYVRLVEFISWAKVQNPDTQFEADVALCEIDMLRTELAALKARRCDGCWHYASTPLSASGRCGLPESAINAPMELDSPSASIVELLVDADHACNAWTPKENA